MQCAICGFYHHRPPIMHYFHRNFRKVEESGILHTLSQSAHISRYTEGNVMRIRRVLCSFLVLSLTFFFGVAATGPEFAPFALVAFITAYALSPDFGFPVPIYHGVPTCLHNLPRYVCWNSQYFVPNTDYTCCQATSAHPTWTDWILCRYATPMLRGWSLLAERTKTVN